MKDICLGFIFVDKDGWCTGSHLTLEDAMDTAESIGCMEGWFYRLMANPKYNPVRPYILQECKWEGVRV